MKKTLCTLLVLCGLLLSACGGNTTVDPTPTKSQSDNTVPTDTATETEPADRTYLDDLPDGLDYGGYDFRVLVYEGGNLPTGTPAHGSITLPWKAKPANRSTMRHGSAISP